MTYAGAGVDYDPLDAFKRAAQLAAAETSGNAEQLGVAPVEWSRGESAYLARTCGHYIGMVEEGLGTKNLVADLYDGALASSYDKIAKDTVAMIVNDMITLGISPAVVAMHLAVGDSAWFKHTRRTEALVRGWKEACMEARCIWGGGETPVLKGIIEPKACLLSGSSWGMNSQRLIEPKRVAHGDRILLLTSSGIHANGLTLARAIADKHPEGYTAKLSDGREYGAALLDPTHIYVGFIEDCINVGIDFHYLVNITGHGWRKLMRAPQSLAYVIDHIPTPHPVFSFIQEHGNVSNEEMYGNLNMGAGFALFVPADEVERVYSVMGEGNYPFAMLDAGVIVESPEKKVIIKPLDLEFTADTLQVR
jgi:phosphoribosylformylglycinamidine cyclo-ligase